MESILEKKLNKNRPDLAPSSVKTYLATYRRVSKNIGETLMTPRDFSIHIEKILKYIEGINVRMKRPTIAAIVSLLKEPGMDKDTEKVVTRYADALSLASKELNDIEDDQEMTERQKEAYLPWPEILKVYQKLKQHAEPLWKIKAEYVTGDIFEILQYYVLLSCYVLIPPRRALDYAVFKIRNFDSSAESKDNYMTDGKGKTYFVFNTYKNAKRLGAQKFEIPLELKKIINKWKNMNPGDYLLMNSMKKKIHATRINRMLAEIFKRNIGSSLLRHSYLTHHFGNIDLNNLETTAAQMGSSSIKRILRYVDKEKAKEEREDDFLEEEA